MKFCATCDVDYPDSERFCPRDGTALRSREKDADVIGTVIADRYLVLQKLGEGGMGHVYLAEHVRMRRKSAVKVMRAGMANDPDALSRFNREAANACQIQHPNVAAIYDFGEGSDGRVYLAMEYVEGQSLAHLLATTGGSLAPARAADIARQVADGLDVAHRLGIVHRDLKPDNILVGRRHDGGDLVKVVDFGISKATDGDAQTVTRTGQIVGTPDYMSPEQLSGEHIDLRSDIYSLAIVAYTMFTGALPFRNDNAQTSMVARLTDAPRPLANARPGVSWPPELQAAFDRALSLSVNDRFPSAPAFAAALAEPAARTPTMDSRTATTTVSSATATPSPTVTPSFPVASGLSAAELATIETRLASAIGPIARVLVRRAALVAPSREALLSALAAEIDTAAERERFQKACER